MNNNKKKTFTRLLLPLAIAAASNPAIANDTGFALEEVVVTAQKRSQNLQDVPIAIDAFSENAVKERGIDGAADLAIHTPSLKYGEAVGAAQLSIRGVGFGLVTGAGENSVAVHSDGVYIANPGAVAMLQSGASAIEVLKGPQGTLWGRNATAGVVNFVTTAPTDEVSGHAKLGAGNYGLKSVEGSINLPFSDNVRTRLSVSTSDRDGIISNPNGDLGGNDQQDIRFAVDTDVSDNLSAQVRLFNAELELDGPVFQLSDSRILNNTIVGNRFADSYDTDPQLSLITEDTKLKDELKGGSVRFDYDINDNLSLVSLTGYVDYERKIDNIDNDGTSVDYVTLDRAGTDKTLSQEFNLSGSSNDFEWLLGVFYMEQDITNNALNIDMSNAAGVPLVFDINFEEEVESIAAFFDTTYDLNDTTRLFGGVRYMEEEREGRITSLGCSSRKKLEDDVVTGRFGAQFDISDTTMLYAQASTGYKSGGNSTSACNDDFKPEELDALEVGFKSELMDGQLRLNGAIFTYDYSDMQVEEVLRTSAVVNNADAKIRGAEIDGMFAATENLEFNFGLTLLDTEYTKFVNADILNDPTFTPQDLSGNPLLRSPEWTAVVGGQYSWMLDHGEIIFRTDVKMSHAYQLREFDHPMDEQDSYTTVNVRLSYTTHDEQWRVTAWGKNITDEEVIISMINNNSLAGSTAGHTGWPGTFYADPATYGLDVEYRF